MKPPRVSSGSAISCILSRALAPGRVAHPKKRPKRTGRFVSKLPLAKAGTVKHWNPEILGLALFVGTASKTSHVQKDGGPDPARDDRALPGNLCFGSSGNGSGVHARVGQGAGKPIRSAAPTLGKALAACPARPKFGSEVHKTLLRQQFGLHLKDWLKLPLTETTTAMRHRALAATHQAPIIVSSMSGQSGTMRGAPMRCRKARPRRSSGSGNSRTAA